MVNEKDVAFIVMSRPTKWQKINPLKWFVVELFRTAYHGPRGVGHSHTLPIRVCTAQRGRDSEAPDLERGIHFRGVF